MKLKTYKYRAALLFFFSVIIYLKTPAQIPQPDTTVIFTPSNPNLIHEQAYSPTVNTWGLDILLSNNGFGLGTFYRHEFSDNLAMTVNFAISDVKDDAEVEQYNYYYGDTYIPGKKNRLLLIPLTVSMQYRLFKDDIAENLRPYVTAGIGPTMVYVSPYVSGEILYDFFGYPYREKLDFFTSLKYGHPRYTLGGFIGVGAFFGMDKGTMSGLSIKYFIAPFPDGIEVMEGGFMKNFGGLYIMLTFSGIF